LQFNTTGDCGFFAASADTGAVLWGFTSFTDLKGDTISIGNSRSSPAIDQFGQCCTNMSFFETEI
jgi:hypothetical protein